MFSRFLPEALVPQVLAMSDGEATIGAELLTGTVLFADLRSFTAFAEGLPVRRVIDVLNRYLSLMTDAVLDHDGTLNRLHG